MKIIIVDDDKLVCDSLKIILGAQPGIEVVGLGSSGDDAVRLSRELAPDVALLDIQMPGRDGLSAAREILAENPSARVVFLTTFSDDEYIVAALKLGARGYLIKTDVQTISPALTQMMKGKRVLEGKPADRVDFSTGVEEAGSHERTEISTPPPIDGDVFGSRNVEFFPGFFPAFPQQENRPEAYGLQPASFLVAGKGIEPLTRGFSVPCSTNWATQPNMLLSARTSISLTISNCKSRSSDFFGKV